MKGLHKLEIMGYCCDMIVISQSHYMLGNRTESSQGLDHEELPQHILGLE